MSFIAKGNGKFPPDSIRTKASIITKVAYKNTKRKAWKAFYFYSKLTPQIVIGNFSCHPKNKLCSRFENIDLSNTLFLIVIRHIWLNNQAKVNVLIIDWPEIIVHQSGLRPIPIWYKSFALILRNRNSVTPYFRNINY